MFKKGHALACVHNVVTPGLTGGHSLVVRACGLNCYIKKISLYSFLKLSFSQYQSIHTNYIISHCTTL